jgi:HAE1 family hydrophobic/amphiphilic exporter-1
LQSNKANAQGVALSDFFVTLQAQLGSLYINDYSQFGRTYKVTIQAQTKYRKDPSDLRHYSVRNTDNDMVPLTTLAKLTPILGPTTIKHFNLYRSANITGQAAPGYSSGQAISVMEELAENLPQGYIYERSGQFKQELEASDLAPVLFILAIFLFIYS